MWVSRLLSTSLPLLECGDPTSTPRGLFGRNGLMAVHSKSVSSYLIIRSPGSGA